MKLGGCGALSQRSLGIIDENQKEKTMEQQTASEIRNCHTSNTADKWFYLLIHELGDGKMKDC